MAGAVEIDWRLLGEMDYITGQAPMELKTLEGKMVRLPGFVVPLEDNSRMVKEFLLVPTPQACIHVPPPPSNQMVFVKMEKEVSSEQIDGPVWLYGKLSLSPKKHMYGEASFEILGFTLEPYK